MDKHLGQEVVASASKPERPKPAADTGWLEETRADRDFKPKHGCCADCDDALDEMGEPEDEGFDPSGIAAAVVLIALAAGVAAIILTAAGVVCVALAGLVE